MRTDNNLQLYSLYSHNTITTEEDEEYTGRGNFRHTRLCRTDPVVHVADLACAGLYYPNYPFENATYKVDINSPKPLTSATNWQELHNKWSADNTMRDVRTIPARDESLNEAFKALAPQMTAPAHASGVFYVAKWDPLTGWLGRNASTYSVIKVDGVVLGVTVLHVLHNKDIPANEFQCFVDVTSKRDKERLKDIQKETNDGFERVELCNNPLHIRSKYIASIKTLQNNSLIAENTDPDFLLQPHPTMDVLFFKLPQTIIESRFYIELAPALPSVDSICVVVGYNTTVIPSEWEQLINEEYATTTQVFPGYDKLVYPDRSVSIGKISNIGSGLINTVISLAPGSSGAVVLDSNLKVFAISLGGFYDKSDSGEKEPKTWTLQAAKDIYKTDIYVPQNTANLANSKNRCLNLSIFHPCFMEMLCAAVQEVKGT